MGDFSVGERHGEHHGGVYDGTEVEFDLGSSRSRRARLRDVAPPDRDGDLGPIGRADGLAERQDHLRAVDLLPGVDRHRAVVEVGVEGRAAGGPDGAAVERELVRRDRDAVRGRVVYGHRVGTHHRGRVRGGRAGCRFRCAGKVKRKLRGASDVHRRAEGHRRLDFVADGVGVVVGVGGELDRRYVRGDGRQRPAGCVAVGPGGDVAGPRYSPLVTRECSRS